MFRNLYWCTCDVKQARVEYPSFPIATMGLWPWRFDHLIYWTYVYSHAVNMYIANFVYYYYVQQNTQTPLEK
jgi:hypothetical protein